MSRWRARSARRRPQLKAGIDIINDGEMPKPSYATYVKDRLTGFGGSGNSYVFQDLEDYPGTKTRMFDDPGRKHRKTPACNAPIRMRDLDAPKQDAQRLQRALGGRAPTGMFLNAASPGVTTLFFRNDFYPSHEEYLFACADALRLEYEAVVASGVTLQIDCPDLAMGRHTQFAHLDRNGFRERMALHVEALNRALVNIPAEKVRMHVCWGNYPGPHHCDVPLADIVDILWTAKPHADPVRGGEPAPRTRMDAVRDREAARGQDTRPRGDRVPIALHRAPGTRRAAHRPLRQPRRPRQRHGRRSIAGSASTWVRAASTQK